MQIRQAVPAPAVDLHTLYQQDAHKLNGLQNRRAVPGPAVAPFGTARARDLRYLARLPDCCIVTKLKHLKSLHKQIATLWYGCSQKQGWTAYWQNRELTEAEFGCRLQQRNWYLEQSQYSRRSKRIRALPEMY